MNNQKLIHVKSNNGNNNKMGGGRNEKLLLLILIFLMMFSLTGCSATEIVNKAGDFFGFTLLGESKEEPEPAAKTEDLPVIVFETTEEPQPEPEIVTTPEAPVYDAENKIYSIETASDSEIVLTFAGDICFYDEYANMGTLRAQNNGIYGCILPEVMKEMTESDIFMVNNEFAYSDRGAPIEGKTYAFRAKPENAKLLHDMGVDIVSLANNHAYDYGPEALYDTIDILNEEKVPFVGAGKNIEEAMKPAYFKTNGKTISYVSATQIERTANPDTKEATENSPGVLRTLEPDKFLTVIEEAEKNSDFVVVYVHWGSENTDLVEWSQRELAQKYAEAGADLIIGDHSHCLQGIDYIDEVPVIYSLGNFWFNSKTVDTGLFEVTLNAEASIQSCRFVPCIQQNCKTRIADAAESQRILTYMQGISNYAQIDMDGTVTKSDTDHNVQNGMNTSPSKKEPEPEAGLLPAVPTDVTQEQSSQTD